MLTNILLDNAQIEIYNDGTKIKIENTSSLLFNLFEGAYSSPSFAVTPLGLTTQISKGIWCVINYISPKEYKESKFDKLVFAIKPKYNFLTIYLCENENYKRKPLTINLSTSTTSLFKYLTNTIKQQRDK